MLTVELPKSSQSEESLTERCSGNPHTPLQVRTPGGALLGLPCCVAHPAVPFQAGSTVHGNSQPWQGPKLPSPRSPQRCCHWALHLRQGLRPAHSPQQLLRRASPNRPFHAYGTLPTFQIHRQVSRFRFVHRGRGCTECQPMVSRLLAMSAEGR